ncbi:MAG: hypothetical protein SGPRY_002319 [Prymnesium sp.]
MCLLERRVNVNPLRSAKVPLLQRTATYDGEEHLSTITPVRGTLLADRLQLLCIAMVNHIKAVSPHRQTISRMLLNFKSGPISVPRQLVPLKSPHTQVLGKTSEHSHGVCPFTGVMLDYRHQYFVTYKKCRLSLLVQARSCTAPAVSIIDYAIYLEEYLDVPPQERTARFEQVCTEMTPGKYMASLKHPQFVNKRVMVSEEVRFRVAYLEFSTINLRGIWPNPSALSRSRKDHAQSNNVPVLPAISRGGSISKGYK